MTSPRPSIEHPTLAAAVALLGLDASMSWADMQRRYRSCVLASHPDLSRGSTDATSRTAELNVAWAAVAAATENGTRPLPELDGGLAAQEPGRPTEGPERARHDEVAVEPLVTLHAPPGDVFVQLLEAAHEVGDVSYMDPEAGLIQVLLNGAPASAQLLISIDTRTEPASASFTLDAMHEETAPSIHDVVEQIAQALSSR